jgi:HEAT repeat protein
MARWFTVKWRDSAVHANLVTPRIFALIVTAALLFAPRLGVAFVRQAKATPQTQPSATPPANPPPATPPANPPAPANPARAEVPVSPREHAWQVLEDACSGDKVADRATAILVLGLIPNDSKSTRLAQKALADQRPEVRAAAAAALGNMPSRVSIPKLKAAIEDPDPGVALAAAHSLDLMHDDSAYEVYYAVLNGERKAGRGLIQSQTSLLHDPKKMAQLGFEEGIGFIPFAGIGWGAIKVIRQNDSSPVRAAAAKVLARDPDPATTTALIEATGDNSWIVQAAALEALAKRGDPSALPAAERYLTDEKAAIRLTAAAAVIHLSAIQHAHTRKQRQTPEHKQP